MLRPLAIGEILDVGLKVYRNAFPAMIRAASVISIPGAVLETLIVNSGSTNGQSQNPIFAATGNFSIFQIFHGGWTLAADFLLYFLVQLMLNSFTVATCIACVADTYLDRKTSARKSLTFALRRFPSLVWLELMTQFFSLAPVVGLIGLAVALGQQGASRVAFGFTILGVVAAFCLMVSFYVVWVLRVPALLLEGKHNLKALGRSFSLVKRDAGKAINVILTAYIMATFLSLPLILLIAGLFNSLVGSDLSWVVTGVVALGTSLALTPMQASIYTVFYFDQRVRMEGYDIELLAQVTFDKTNQNSGSKKLVGN